MDLGHEGALFERRQQDRAALIAQSKGAKNGSHIEYVRAHVKLLEIAFAAGALTCMFYSLYRAHEVAVIAVDASTVGDDFVAFSTATALLEKSAGGTDKTL